VELETVVFAGVREDFAETLLKMRKSS